MHLSLKRKPSFLIVNTTLNITNYHAISKRVEGFNDYFLKNNIENQTFTLSIDNFNDLEETRLKINSYLDKNKSIKGIFVPSSRISAIVDAIDDQYLDKLEFLGFDNTEQNIQCLEDDKVAFLISQKPFEQGFEAINLMANYLVKNQIPARKIYSPIDILTKENARYNERNEREFQHNDH
jgi:LacI family transcriptional regulator